jgi:hypothetical protein
LIVETADNLRGAFRDYFGLEPRTAEILRALYKANGVCLSAEALGLTGSCLRLHICRLREAMEPEAIDRNAGAYALTEIGLGECKAALWLMAEEYRKLAEELRAAA